MESTTEVEKNTDYLPREENDINTMLIKPLQPQREQGTEDLINNNPMMNEPNQLMKENKEKLESENTNSSIGQTSDAPELVMEDCSSEKQKNQEEELTSNSHLVHDYKRIEAQLAMKNIDQQKKGTEIRLDSNLSKLEEFAHIEGTPESLYPAEYEHLNIDQENQKSEDLSENKRTDSIDLAEKDLNKKTEITIVQSEEDERSINTMAANKQVKEKEKRNTEPVQLDSLGIQEEEQKEVVLNMQDDSKVDSKINYQINEKASTFQCSKNDDNQIKNFNQTKLSSIEKIQPMEVFIREDSTPREASQLEKECIQNSPTEEAAEISNECSTLENELQKMNTEIEILHDVQSNNQTRNAVEEDEQIDREKNISDKSASTNQVEERKEREKKIKLKVNVNDEDFLDEHEEIEDLPKKDNNQTDFKLQDFIDETKQIVESIEKSSSSQILDQEGNQIDETLQTDQDKTLLGTIRKNEEDKSEEIKHGLSSSLHKQVQKSKQSCPISEEEKAIEIKVATQSEKESALSIEDKDKYSLDKDDHQDNFSQIKPLDSHTNEKIDVSTEIEHRQSSISYLNQLNSETDAGLVSESAECQKIFGNNTETEALKLEVQNICKEEQEQADSLHGRKKEESQIVKENESIVVTEKQYENPDIQYLIEKEDPSPARESQQIEKIEKVEVSEKIDSESNLETERITDEFDSKNESKYLQNKKDNRDKVAQTKHFPIKEEKNEVPTEEKLIDSKVNQQEPEVAIRIELEGSTDYKTSRNVETSKLQKQKIDDFSNENEKNKGKLEIENSLGISLKEKPNFDEKNSTPLEDKRNIITNSEQLTRGEIDWNTKEPSSKANDMLENLHEAEQQEKISPVTEKPNEVGKNISMEKDEKKSTSITEEEICDNLRNKKDDLDKSNRTETVNKNEQVIPLDTVMRDSESCEINKNEKKVFKSQESEFKVKSQDEEKANSVKAKIKKRSIEGERHQQHELPELLRKEENKEESENNRKEPLMTSEGAENEKTDKTLDTDGINLDSSKKIKQSRLEGNNNDCSSQSENSQNVSKERLQEHYRSLNVDDDDKAGKILNEPAEVDTFETIKDSGANPKQYQDVTKIVSEAIEIKDEHSFDTEVNKKPGNKDKYEIEKTQERKCDANITQHGSKSTKNERVQSIIKNETPHTTAEDHDGQKLIDQSEEVVNEPKADKGMTEYNTEENHSGNSKQTEDTSYKKQSNLLNDNRQSEPVKQTMNKDGRKLEEKNVNYRLNAEKNENEKKIVDGQMEPNHKKDSGMEEDRKLSNVEIKKLNSDISIYKRLHGNEKEELNDQQDVNSTTKIKKQNRRTNNEHIDRNSTELLTGKKTEYVEGEKNKQENLQKTPQKTKDFQPEFQKQECMDELSVQHAKSGHDSKLKDNVFATNLSKTGKAPICCMNLSDRTVTETSMLKMTCMILGDPNPEIRWFKDDIELSPCSDKYRTNVDISIISLEIYSVQPSDSGKYSCRATNVHGRVRTEAQLKVVPASNEKLSRPTFTRSIRDSYREDTNELILECQVVGHPLPTITWLKDQHTLEINERYQQNQLADGICRLRISKPDMLDSGLYTCKAKNDSDFSDRTSHIINFNVKGYATPEITSTKAAKRETDTPLRTQTPDNHVGQTSGVQQSSDVATGIYDHYGNDTHLHGGYGEVLPGNVKNAGYAATFASRPVVKLITIASGEDMSVSFRTAGIPKPKVILMKGLRDITNGPKSYKEGHDDYVLIVLKRIQKSDEGTYCILVKNRYGCDRHFFTIMVKEHIGESLDWHGGNTECIWSNTNSGTYICDVMNSAGRVSPYSRVQINKDSKIIQADHKHRTSDGDGGRRPEFITRLRDVRIQAHDPVKLTCQVIGNPKPEILWFKYTENLCSRDNLSIWNDDIDNHILEISHSTFDDSGVYVAKATNTYGSVSCRCHIIVDNSIQSHVAPQFLCQLKPVYTVTSGSNLHMTAQIKAYPSAEMTWHHDGQRLESSRDVVMSSHQDGTIELKLIGVLMKDAGFYCCEAINEVGRTKNTARVDVVERNNLEHSWTESLSDITETIDTPYSKKPLFITKPLSTEAFEGDTVIILCEVIGDPKPEVIWLRDFLQPDYYKDGPHHFKRVGLGPQYQLEIPYAKLDFTGTYSVIARNCYGEAKAIISLQIFARGQGYEGQSTEQTIKHGNVQTLPVIKRPLRDIKCFYGDAITFSCNIYATPTPNIRWEKSGKLISLGSDFTTEFDRDVASLNIQHVYPEDAGEYTCVAHNELGMVASSAYLIVDDSTTDSTHISTSRSTPVRSYTPLQTLRATERSGKKSRRPCAPKFYTVPYNRVVEVGDTASFECSITGQPLPWIVWDKDGNSIVQSNRISLSERKDVRLLEISNVVYEDAGLYRVTLENELGKTEATARLEVIRDQHKLVSRRSASPSLATSNIHLPRSEGGYNRGTTLSPTLSYWNDR